MQISRAALPLRTEAFPTLPREITRSVSLQYTGTAPDPRIDANALDYFDSCRGALGCFWHYLVRIDGRVEIGRNPRAISTRTASYAATNEAIHVGIVGGYDPETGERCDTITPEQAVAVEELLQALADALNVPLEVHEAHLSWTKDAARLDREAELEAELEADLDAIEGSPPDPGT